MTSWRAKLLNTAVRLVVRRRSWGEERLLVRRSRIVFGAPRLYRSIVAWGLRRERVRVGSVCGGWLEPNVPLAGVLLYVHGGGFVSCSAATHRPIAAALARFTQRRVFSLDYRLAPEYRFPAAVEDVLAAYEWLLATGAVGQSIALAGDSAGGNLVLAASISLRDDGRPMPVCLVAFSPWTDLAGTGPSARENDRADPMFRYENLADFAGVYLGAVPASAPDASPVYADLAGLPPVLLHVGSTEILLDDARRVDEAIKQTGGVSRLQVYDNVPHGWQMLCPLVPEATSSLRDAAAFASHYLSLRDRETGAA